MQAAANPYLQGSDESYIYESLQLAHGGLGWTRPNPLVGCVLVKNDSVIGRGWHQVNGQQHAETNALQNAGDARGATAYVSLEPCTHVGRQPSCCHELHQAGVTRVVYGATDTDPRTAGQAQPVLIERGITVTGGVLKDECERLLDYYLYTNLTGKLFVHLKLALSIDARLACANGASQWLSGPQSLGYAHYLRQKYDAIFVGYKTVLADNPRLSTRSETMQPYRELGSGPKPRNPIRIVLDLNNQLAVHLGDLQIADTESGYFRDGLPRLIIVTKPGVTTAGHKIKGYEQITIEPGANGQILFEELNDKLWQLGIRSMLVEGGAGVARAMLGQNAVQKLSLVYTPVIIGGDGLSFAPNFGYSTIDECQSIKKVKFVTLGSDCLMSGYLQH